MDGRKTIDNFYNINIDPETMRSAGVMAATLIVFGGIWWFIHTQMNGLMKNIFNFIRKTLLKSAPIVFTMVWIALIIRFLMYPNSSLGKNNGILEMFKSQYFLNVFLKEWPNVLISFGFAMIVLFILYFSSALSLLFQLAIVGASAVLGYSQLLSVINSGEFTYMHAIGFMFCILLFALVIYLFKALTDHIFTDITSGSRLVLRNLIFILPVVAVCSVIIGLVLTTTVSLLVSSEYSFLYSGSVVFISLWTVNALIYFVKTFSATIFRHKDISKNNRETFLDTLLSCISLTLRYSNILLYLSFIPAFFDFLLLLIDHAIYLFKKSPTFSGILPDFISETLRLVTKKLILNILYLLKYIVLIIKGLVLYDIEFSVAQIGYYNSSLDLSEIEMFDKMEERKSRGIINIITGSIFRYIFHLIPLYVFTFLAVIINTKCSLLVALNYIFSNIYSFLFLRSVLSHITDICISNGQEVVLFGVCVFIVYSILSSAFTGLIYSYIQRDIVDANKSQQNTIVGENIKTITVNFPHTGNKTRLGE